jgi:hypothetical protein
MTELPEFAISLSQPWCWAILECGKDVENRRWPTRFRGPITLHAAKSWDEDGEAWLDDCGFNCPTLEALPAGAYVGTATITHCWRYSDRELDRSGRYLWAFGPWCFDLADVRALATPIPARGRLGVYRRPELARVET